MAQYGSRLEEASAELVAARGYLEQAREREQSAKNALRLYEAEVNELERDVAEKRFRVLVLSGRDAGDVESLVQRWKKGNRAEKDEVEKRVLERV